MMQSITKFIDQQQTPSSLSAAQLKDLLENSYGSRDVLSLSKDYTEDTPALLELLLKIHSHTENRTLKVRCTKLRKKLQRQMECEPQMWKKVKNISGIETYSTINAIQKNDTIITRKEDIAEELAEHYKQNSTNANYEESFHTQSCPRIHTDCDREQPRCN
ncbi:hypothetical protein JTB14_022669 [Gonioctena quinquepunctata]|nr:hypothetical protein JTB14_022669 [Gonioctena quinquepunctata]